MAWSCIRTRSPSSAPPENGEDGSTASTPTRLPCSAVRRDQRRRRGRLADAGRAGQADDLAWPACGASAAITSRSCGVGVLDQRDQPRDRAGLTLAGARDAASATRRPRRPASGGHAGSGRGGRAAAARRPGRRRRTARPRRVRRRAACSSSARSARAGRRTCRSGGPARSRRR